MVRRSRPLLAGLALSAALAVAGCGGDGGDKTFDNENIGITFKYSPRFHPITEIDFGHTAGAKAAAQSGVALDKVNALIVSRYDLNVKIDKDNLSKFKGEVDNVISRLAGHRVSGQEVEYGGFLPRGPYAANKTLSAYFRAFKLINSLELTPEEKTAPQGQSRMAVLFDQATEYLINCQSTPTDRDEIEEGCRKALDTLETK